MLPHSPLSRRVLHPSLPARTPLSPSASTFHPASATLDLFHPTKDPVSLIPSQRTILQTSENQALHQRKGASGDA